MKSWEGPKSHPRIKIYPNSPEKACMVRLQLETWRPYLGQLLIRNSEESFNSIEHLLVLLTVSIP